MMLPRTIIKNDVRIEKLYSILFSSALKFLSRAVKLSLFLFCFSASVNIQSSFKKGIEPFSVAFSEELSIEKAKIAKAVWKIKISTSTSTSTNIGTGFFISENKLVTNFHMVFDVKDIEYITIIQEGNPRQLKVNKIVSLSIKYDLAVLEVDGFVSDFLSLPKGRLNSSKVYALGYPGGQFQEIRQTGDLKVKAGYFLSDNSNTEGASGSPILNETHQLAGVLYAGLDNIVLFISVEILIFFIRDEYFLCEGNVQECVKSLRKSIEKNTQEIKNGKDFYNVNLMYGWGGVERAIELFAVEQDLNRAIELFEEVAKQGYALSQYRLGFMYYHIRGRVERAIELFEEAAE